jgi:L-ribulose-5-phosphate 4-epimerase
MLENLKNEVCLANLDLVKHGLVILTWGNASAIDRKKRLVVIKPSGVDYSQMKPESMVVIDMDGNVVEGRYKPSSDTATHLELYKNFPEIGAVVHTHSTWATIWAQAGKDVPALGTTHADYFHGDIPCTRPLNASEIEGQYEVATGKVIAKTFAPNRQKAIPGVLVHGHGPFCWGKNSQEAILHAMVMEEVSKMAYSTLQLAKVPPIDKSLLDKHFLRKHGKKAYYGQARDHDTEK